MAGKLVAEDAIAIEVAFATPEKQQVVSLKVPEGTLIRDAVRLSDIASHFPGQDFSAVSVGVWKEVKPETYVVQPGDRVEVYRPLITNAKDARRRRAAAQANKGAK